MVQRVTPSRILAISCAALCALVSQASQPPAELPGDRMLSTYFAEETARVHAGTFAGIKKLEDWTSKRDEYREQLHEMLGLSPLPERGDLRAVVTGREEHAEFVVEKLQYQALPGLYVTGNLYLPKTFTGKAPAILYVCGHANVKEGKVSYGAKVNYQHHGQWFARHGYVCLTIDTIELGELEGQHHGTYREGMWWWNARGYTPAGVEAWNSIRALDYLQSRPEVDGERIGMTGRSGGGAYTWYTAALDERVKAVVPVAGITDLRNYVIDGCVAGHCDCMFWVNTYRWDYAKLAALIAPRPLLISNSDKDKIFPLDGVVRVHSDVAAIYRLYNASDKLGLLITEGVHKDTQDLQVPAFRWFNRFLKGEEPLITRAAEKLLKPAQLKVFSALPSDQRTTKIHESFVPMAAPAVPANAAEWQRQKASWNEALREKVFGGWPEQAEPLNAKRVTETRNGAVTLSRWEFTSQGAVQLPLFVFARDGAPVAREVRLHILDEKGWGELVASLPLEGRTAAADTGVISGGDAKSARHRELLAQVERGEITLVYLPPRGIGPTAWTSESKAAVQIRRRFMLVGQTLDGMRVWDIRRAVEALREPAVFGKNVAVSLSGEGNQSVNALYASLFTEGVAAVEMLAPPLSHHTGPDYLNILRFLDVPQAVALAAEQRPVRIVRGNPDDWSWASRTAQRLGWPSDRVQW